MGQYMSIEEDLRRLWDAVRHLTNAVQYVQERLSQLEEKVQ